MASSDLYGRVQDDEVVEGPRTLPASWRTDETEILAFDRLDDPTPYGWWPWVEEAAPAFDPETQWLEPSIRLDTDGKRIVRSYTAVALPPVEIPVPERVFDYQFAGEAEARGIITTEECDAWVGPGVVPKTLLDKVALVVPDPEARRRVVLFLKGSKEFPRYHPNTVALAALFRLDSAEKIDTFFISASRR